MPEVLDDTAAAVTDPPPPGGAGSRRGRFAARAATFGVLAVAGALFVASAITSRGTDLRADSATDLRDLIAHSAQGVDALQQQVADLQDEVQALSAAQGGGPLLAAERARLAALSPAAGFTPVVGPSVTVSLTDAPKPPAGQQIPGNPTPDDLVVHQQDVQAVVNAMWRGGASGMRIMDQRVIATSAVRCVGNTLILQGRVYSPPFVVTAVGDQARITAELDQDPSVSIYREFATLYGLGYEVKQEASTTLPAFEGALTLTHARPMPS